MPLSPIFAALKRGVSRRRRNPEAAYLSLGAGIVAGHVTGASSMQRCGGRFDARITHSTELLEDRTMLSGVADPTALDLYVAEPDASYEFTHHSTIAGTGYTGYVLDVTSQTWRDASEVNKPVWDHWVTVIIPDTVTETTAFLSIGGGSTDSAPTSVDSDLATFATYTNSIVVELPTVPNQPLTFLDDGVPRTEDSIIAYSLNKYYDTGDDTWPVLLAMVNSAVRTMDAVQTFVPDITSGAEEVTDFVVSGGSKRGWTTWLTAAVDERVSAIAPAVIDVLNMGVQIPHHYDHYEGVTELTIDGASWVLGDYIEFDIFERLNTPEGIELGKIIDPYSYIGREQLELPKYIVNSAGDQFFVPDSSQFYFHDLQGEDNYLRYVPNTGHGLNADAVTGILYFYDALLDGAVLPEFSWAIEGQGTTIRVNTVDTPLEVKLWQATNTENRDFRQNTFGNGYTSSTLSDTGGGEYVATVSPPATGATAFFVEMTYMVNGTPIKFTTDVSVIPDVTPPEVTLVAPTQTSDTTPAVAVSATDLHVLPDGTVVLLDVDLTGDGDFDDSGEAGYASSTLTAGRATFETPTLGYGTYTFQARVTDPSGNEGASDPHEIELAPQTTGLFFNKEGASDGYTLFSPNTTTTTYLIDQDGNVVNEWQSDYAPGLLAYLLEDGSLLRASAPNGTGGNGSINAAGSGGLLERFDWHGNKIWEFSYDTATQLQHHDFEVLPNGNVLLIAWETKSETEATEAGRDPGLPGPGFLYPDHIIEVEPDLVSGVGGNIVWEWYVWDHLVQDFDPTKDNWHGPTGVADHPELIDINYVSVFDEGGGAAEDWTHANGIDYNPELDQIVLSVREFSEFWIIDHSTTTAEAASHSGGNSGKGGDLLYRWGNPETHDAGDDSDRVLFYQHDAKWIPAGLPGAGNITVLNNGYGQPGDDFTTVLEIAPPADYSLTPTEAETILWSYEGPPEDFTPIISGTQRLENGNTLITYGVGGRISEVTPDGEEVWRYVNPYTLDGELGENDAIPNLGISGGGLEALLTNFVFRAIHYAPGSFATPGADIVARDAANGQWRVALSTGTSFDTQIWGGWNPANTYVDVFLTDVDGDGLDDLIGLNDANGQWLVSLSTGTSFAAPQVWATWNPTRDIIDVQAADFNNDGLTDIAGRDADNGQWRVNLSTGTAFGPTEFWAAWNPNRTIINVLSADFNNDGRADIAGRDANSGQWRVNLSTGTTFGPTEFWTDWNPSRDIIDVFAADFDGDDQADIAGRDSATGVWRVNLSTGTGFTTTEFWTDWNPTRDIIDVFSADFNNDGMADIAGRDSATGVWRVNLSTGTGFTTTEFWTDWNPNRDIVDVQSADFNGDGRADIAGRDSVTGVWRVNLSTGSSFTTTEFWGSWNPTRTYVDVLSGDVDGASPLLGDSVADEGSLAGTQSSEEQVDQAFAELSAPATLVAETFDSQSTSTEEEPESTAVAPSTIARRRARPLLNDSESESLLNPASVATNTKPSPSPPTANVSRQTRHRAVSVALDDDEAGVQEADDFFSSLASPLSEPLLPL